MPTAGGTVGESHAAELADVGSLALVMNSNVQPEQWHGVKLATAVVARKLLREMPQLVVLHVAVIVERPAALVAHIALDRTIDLRLWSPLSDPATWVPLGWRWTVVFLDLRHPETFDHDTWRLTVGQLMFLLPQSLGRWQLNNWFQVHQELLIFIQELLIVVRVACILLNFLFKQWIAI